MQSVLDLRFTDPRPLCPGVGPTVLRCNLQKTMLSLPDAIDLGDLLTSEVTRTEVAP